MITIYNYSKYNNYQILLKIFKTLRKKKEKKYFLKILILNIFFFIFF